VKWLIERESECIQLPARPIAFDAAQRIKGQLAKSGVRRIAQLCASFAFSDHFERYGDVTPIDHEKFTALGCGSGRLSPAVQR
jgi:hypothetical protein